MTADFDQDTMYELAQWVTWFSSEWRKEDAQTPTKVHSSQIAEDGSREWHPDFAKYMSDDQRKVRTRKVFRKLRRTNVRAYEVCYRVLVLGEPLDETTEWLNVRALRNEIPFPAQRPAGPHYVRKDTLALLLSGVTFARQYW